MYKILLSYHIKYGICDNIYHTFNIKNYVQRKSSMKWETDYSRSLYEGLLSPLSYEGEQIGSKIKRGYSV